MHIFLTIVHVIVCFMLIIVILLQAGRGQGLTGGAFGSGNVQSVLGTRAADFLTKATSVAAICFLFTCLGLDFIEVRRSKSLMQAEATRGNLPINIDQIKQALEKVKNESGAEGAAGEAAGVAQGAAAQVQEAAEAVQQEAAK